MFAPTNRQNQQAAAPRSPVGSGLDRSASIFRRRKHPGRIRKPTLRRRGRRPRRPVTAFVAASAHGMYKGIPQPVGADSISARAPSATADLVGGTNPSPEPQPHFPFLSQISASPLNSKSARPAWRRCRTWPRCSARRRCSRQSDAPAARARWAAAAPCPR